jgi:hypothetical protein
MNVISRETGEIPLPDGLGDKADGVALGDRRYLVIVRRRDEKIAQITLIDSDPAFGTSWDDYTEDKELARRAAHDAMLERDLGAPTRIDEPHFYKEWTLPWGKVISAHDPRGGTTDVQIIYA